MKNRILVVWDYTRKDYLDFFNLDSPELEFIYLYFFDSNHESDPPSGIKRIFWGDYKNPYRLLKDIKPSKIVFFDIESFYEVSLNLAAKSSNIKTYVLEHGFRADIGVKLGYKQRNQGESVYRKTIEQTKNPSNTLRFYFGSLRFRNLNILIPLLKFLVFRKKYGITVGLHKCPGEFREANIYINFTHFNAGFFRLRDHIQEEKFRYIGNPYLDDLLGKSESISMERSYFLLIDSPLVEVFGMPIKEKLSFLDKLNTFCKRKDKLLYVKLHPKNYDSEYLEDQENIKYLREVDLPSIVAGSDGVMGAYISSLNPAIAINHPYLHFISPHSHGMDDVIKEMVHHHHYDDFNPEDLEFKPLSPENREKIINRFLFKDDGKAKDRLAKLLAE